MVERGMAAPQLHPGAHRGEAAMAGACGARRPVGAPEAAGGHDGSSASRAELLRRPAVGRSSPRGGGGRTGCEARLQPVGSEGVRV